MSIFLFDGFKKLTFNCSPVLFEEIKVFFFETKGHIDLLYTHLYTWNFIMYNLHEYDTCAGAHYPGIKV